MAKLPKALQKIQDLVDNKTIIRASLAKESNTFIYETVCPKCAKAKLDKTIGIDWYILPISCGEPVSKRVDEFQKVLDKRGVSLTLTPDLEDRFLARNDVCQCKAEHPEGIDFTDDEIIRADENLISAAGKYNILVNADRTLVGGRTERIESIAADDLITLDIRANRDEIIIRNSKGEDLGEFPYSLTFLKLMPLIKNHKIVLEGAKIYEIQSRAQRGPRARKATLSIVVTVTVQGKKLTPYTGKHPEASTEYKKLVQTIQADGVEDWLVINYDGILYHLEECEECGGLKAVSGYTFGFDTEDGFFYPAREIPDDDVIEMLEDDGISVQRYEDIDYDMECHCDEDWD